MKYCKECGKQFEDTDKFCDKCGIKLPQNLPVKEAAIKKPIANKVSSKPIANKKTVKKKIANKASSKSVAKKKTVKKPIANKSVAVKPNKKKKLEKEIETNDFVPPKNKTNPTSFFPFLGGIFAKRVPSKSSYKITDACVNCGSCVSDCPVEAISEKDGKHVIDLAKCQGCGICVATCPTDAIQSL